MLKDAAEAGGDGAYDVIVTLDSDLVVHPLFYWRLLAALPLARSGVVSLYNSCYHKVRPEQRQTQP
jgi:hypothetical protein